MKRLIAVAILALCVFVPLVPNDGRTTSPYEIKEFIPLASAFPIKVGGYIKYEAFWDTRQVVGAREDQVLLFPEKQILDSNCDDVNAQGQFTSVAIQTRLRFTIDGPKIKRASTKGIIEYDYFGKDGIANIIRMRHAHILLDWEKTQILAGQAYHPLYIIGVDPRTISFNSGAPIDSFSRNPQFRVTYSPGKHVDLVFAASTQLDFRTDGPIGFSSTYLRDAVVPMLDFRLDTHFGEHIAGVGIDFMRIQPRLKTDTGLKTRERLNRVIAIAFNRLRWDSLDMRTKFIFYQNPTDQNMIGGYAVTCIDPENDRREYTNLNGVAFWNDTDITRHESFIPGWFIGVIKNLGARTPILQNVVDENGTVTDRRIFGVGTDINYIFRIAPRIQWRVKNFMFAVEVEYTRAAFGTIDCDGDVVNTTPVGNTRILASLFYYL